MKLNTEHQRKPSAAPGQTWFIAVGEQTGHLEHPAALAVQIHVVTAGARAGEVEMDVREIEDRRLFMSEAAAELLASEFSRMSGDDGRRIAHALLDSGHIARCVQLRPSTRTHFNELVKELKLDVVADRSQIDIHDGGLIMGEESAEALAHVFSRMQDDEGKRIAGDLLDGAHRVRLAQGKASVRTPLESLR